MLFKSVGPSQFNKTPFYCEMTILPHSGGALNATLPIGTSYYVAVIPRKGIIVFIQKVNKFLILFSFTPQNHQSSIYLFFWQGFVDLLGFVAFGSAVEIKSMELSRTHFLSQYAQNCSFGRSPCTTIYVIGTKTYIPKVRSSKSQD